MTYRDLRNILPESGFQNDKNPVKAGNPKG